MGGQIASVLLAYLFTCRTARGFDCGAALTFVCPREEDQLAELEERLKGGDGRTVL